jgi:hypothetical protein
MVIAPDLSRHKKTDCALFPSMKPTWERFSCYPVRACDCKPNKISRLPSELARGGRVASQSALGCRLATSTRRRTRLVHASYFEWTSIWRLVWTVHTQFFFPTLLPWDAVFFHLRKKWVCHVTTNTTENSAFAEYRNLC